jgi:hypothetical protein
MFWTALQIAQSTLINVHDRNSREIQCNLTGFHFLNHIVLVMTNQGTESISAASRFEILRHWDQRRRLDTSTIPLATRNSAVSHLLAVSEGLNLPETCVALSVRIFDENLSRTEEARLKPDLFAAASLFIAAKVDDVDGQIGCEIADGYSGVSYEQILAVEPSVFKGIDYDCYFATAANFLNHLFSARPDLETGDLKRLVKRIAHVAFMNLPCCEFLAEDLAGACVVLAEKMGREQQPVDDIETETSCASAVLTALKTSQSFFG